MASPQYREPIIPTPTRYEANLRTCAQFLHPCSLVFNQQMMTFTTDQAKVDYTMSLLSGLAVFKKSLNIDFKGQVTGT